MTSPRTRATTALLSDSMSYEICGAAKSAAARRMNAMTDLCFISSPAVFRATFHPPLYASAARRARLVVSASAFVFSSSVFVFRRAGPRPLPPSSPLRSNP